MGRDGDARSLWERAAAAGVVRDKWQCSLKLSPAEWGLRVQPWWSPQEVDGAEELTARLQHDFEAIKGEVVRFFVDQKVPIGVTVQLNREVDAVRMGDWTELILFKRGSELQDACLAVPQLCGILRPLSKRFHAQGMAKLSHFKGSTTSHPHCGPRDSQIRMHFTLALPAHHRAELTVAGITKKWQQGLSMFFDDSVENFVVFDTDADASRIVLIIDFPHPELPSSAAPRGEL
mmetsp:Transcript_26777/g.71287  ORF Transcript_26777/g.71287 Transcript_26777/m.71287 type:complete len:233 (+) Transcript_26777:359-1057(+)